MKIYLIGILLIVISIVLLTPACGTIQPEFEREGLDADLPADSTALPTETSPTEYYHPTPSETSTPADSAAQRYTFDELGISLEVPADLYVKKDPIVNLDDSRKLESYLFYIQNYGYPGGPSSGDFQMYGLLQFSLPTVSWDDFAEIQNNSAEYDYVNYIEINGLRGFDTQLAGERNNFVYLFYLDNHVLRIAISSPTPENKALAEQILNTLELNPEGLSDASHVKLVSDPDLQYQLLIPEDWNYTFNPAAGIRLSDLEASSPDAEIVVEDEEGPHSKFFYKNGVFMNLVVLEDDSARLAPTMANIERQNIIYFNGIEGTEYVFVEPSTAEGELREVRVYYNGKSYLLRFGYSDGAYRDEIDRIIGSLQLQE